MDKGKNITDQINDIDVFEIKQSDGETLAVGWIAKTNYLGSIYDKAVKGIRLRQGNILVGDSQTLNVVFKDARFNGWSMGEVYACDNKLIPNARRDNFEKNPSYFSLFEHLTTKASNIAKDIRTASLSRNTALSSALLQTETVTIAANQAIENGVSRLQKGIIKHELINVKSLVTHAPLSDDEEKYYKSIAFDELDILIGKLQGATSYKALNAINCLGKNEKRILARVFDVIININIDNSDMVIDAILDAFVKQNHEL